MGDDENEEGNLHIEHSVILEHHRYYQETKKAEGGCVDIAIYNQCYNAISTYISKTRPVLNDDTVFLMNVIKDTYRRSQLKMEKKDLIYEICKNHTVAEKWS